MKKKRIYIFDLDHTLFNARDFRQDLGNFLTGDPDISSEEIWDLSDNKDERLFNFIKNKISNYIFDRVVENLKKIPDEKILLSFGNLKFQELKISLLGFDKLFDRVILTDENKISFLRDFADKNLDREIFFINDNHNKRFRENDEIRRNIPQFNIREINNYGDEEAGVPISLFFTDVFKREGVQEEMKAREKSNSQKSSNFKDFGKLR